MTTRGPDFDPEVARFLVSPEGVAAGVGLTGREPERALVEELRRRFDAPRASALLDRERGRRSLEGKDPDARTLHAGYLAAQQSSGAVAAAHRARRFAESGVTRLAEIGCGVGLDTRALARRLRVLAVDLDPGRLVLARANLAALGADIAGRALFARVDVAASALRPDVFYADPDRRADGRRSPDPERASPPLSFLLQDLARRAPARGYAIKLSPLTPLETLRGLGELEFVSVGRELRELVLWGGELARVDRRVSIPGEGGEFVGEPGGRAPDGPLGAYLLDPDPALGRSGLLERFAASCGARLLVPGGSYATADAPVGTPLFRAEPILGVFPAKPAAVRKELRARGLGRVRISRRDFAIDPVAYERQLRLDGRGGIARLHLTRTAEGPRVLLTEPASGDNANPPEPPVRPEVSR